jgi:proline iminopeptidase
MADGALARNAGRLAGIPGILIRGGLDFDPPIDLFWRLAREWPEGELVVIEEEGHLGGPAMDAAVTRAIGRFASSK